MSMYSYSVSGTWMWCSAYFMLSGSEFKCILCLWVCRYQFRQGQESFIVVAHIEVSFSFTCSSLILEVPWDKLLICKACSTMSAICLMPRWGAWRNSVLFCSLWNFTAVLHHSLQTAHVRGSKNVQYPIILFQPYKNIIFILINTWYVFFRVPDSSRALCSPC